MSSSGDAASACRAVDEQLCDLGAVRLVRRQCEHHLHRADYVAVEKGGKKQTAALVDLLRNHIECATCLLV